MKNVS